MTQGGLFDDERPQWRDAGRCMQCGCSLWLNGDALRAKITVSRMCTRGRKHVVSR